MQGNLEQIANELGRARPTSNGYQCKCPAHEDKHPSLSLSYGENGRLLCHCHAGCAHVDVTRALKERGLLPGNKNIYRKKPQNKVWSICDGDGTFIADHIRVDKSDGSKMVFWKPKLSEIGRKVVDMPLYRCNKISDATEVVICEGEKATDAAHRIGLAAVGTVTGAASCPSEKTLSSLTGKRVVLWPDNDEPGRKHMAKIAAILTKLKIENKTINWPGAPPKGDCADFMAQGGTKAQFETLPRKNDESEGRPVIDVGRDQHLVTTDAIRSLKGSKNIYQRHGQLVRAIRIGEKDARPHLPQNSLVIRDVKNSTLRDVLSEVAKFEKWDARSKQMKSSKPSTDVVEAVRDRGEYPEMRTLSGIAEAPFMRQDGSICNTPGYDAATGFLFEPRISFPVVPDEPTQDDARAALKLLSEPFVDFPFVSDSSRAIPIASVLSLLARPMIIGNVPLFLVDASSRAAGKTKTIDVVAKIATGRPAPKLTWPRRLEELEKILAAVAVDASPLISFDNLGSTLRGDALDKILTCGGSTKFRILGKTETPELPWNTVIFASGNNVVVAGDTIRRVIPCRIESPLENPDQRSDFLHPDLLQWVEQERGKLVAAALTILRAWVVAGRPACGCSTIGSFEEWAAIIPPSVVFAGGADPTGGRQTVADSEADERSALIQLLNVVAETFPRGAIAREINAAVEYNSVLQDALKALIYKELTPRSIGKLFQRHKGRVIGGQSLTTIGKRNNNIAWLVVKNAEQQTAEPEQTAMEY